MIKLFVIFLVLISSLYSSTAFEEAYVIYKKGDFKSSFILLKKLAEDEKDYDAAYILAYMYEHGEGTQVDIDESQKWYKFSSRGYYWQIKKNPSNDIDKEKRKLLEGIAQSEDEITRETIRQYSESLYNFKAHNANYFLPISYRSNGEYEPTNGHSALKIETEFQFSLKYDFAANLTGLHEIYSVGYTQQSYWQLYAESAYFRETNYNPEFFMTVPVGKIKNFEYFKAVRVGFEHKSNGRGGQEERSWNYVTGKLYFQTGAIFTELQFWKDVGSLDYNPDLMDYMGYGQLKFIMPYKKHILKLQARNMFSDYRALELNYSHPFFTSKDLFFYVKAFSGYGESLIDYDNKVDKLGIGFSISR